MDNLPDPNDPYIDGLKKVYDPITPEKSDVTAVTVSEYAVRNTIQQLSQFVPTKPVVLDSLPEPDFKEQIAISAVVALRLMGIDITDIADMFSISSKRIEEMLTSPSAQQTFELMLKNVVNHSANIVQGRIASFANEAVTTVHGLMTNEEVRDDVRLKAAQDMLDRSGTNADQFFRTNDADRQADTELSIVIMDEANDAEKIKVSVNKK